MISRADYTDVLMLACSGTLGWHEDPRGSNDAPFIRAWLADVGVYRPAAWCVAGANAMFKAASEQFDVHTPHPKTAGSRRAWEMVPDECKRTTPLVGAAVFFAAHDAGGKDTGHGHECIAREILPDKHVRTWDANSNAEGSRNGDEVVEHTWRWGDGHRGRLHLLGFADLIGLVAR